MNTGQAGLLVPAAEAAPGGRLPTLPLTLIMYSIRLWECFSITDSIQIKGFTCGTQEGTHTKSHFTEEKLRPDLPGGKWWGSLPRLL